ncbi:MAG TPA: Rrf2 family transcriptional regulator [Candidatus Sulfotelmatobacter sp.]|nr:Rrf2 family transcriptional regulator [Candidatus Sulfotelmatobacter sp.]
MTVGISAPPGLSMRVSSRAHYGLRMMTELAKSFGQGPRSLADIARLEQLPLAYLEQLAGQLRRGGLIVSTRGVRGGYTLTKAPAQISVLDVVTLIEGEIAPVECVAHGYEAGMCARESECASRPLWIRIKRSIDAILSETTLAELVADGRLVESLLPVGDPATQPDSSLAASLPAGAEASDPIKETPHA